MCFYASLPLPEVKMHLEDYQKLCGYYGQKGVGVMLSHQLQLCFNFMGRADDPLVLTGEAMNEKETIDFLQGKHPVALAWLLIMKHVLAVYFHDLQQATIIEAQLSKMKTAAILPFVLHSHLFLEALTTATLSRTDPGVIRNSRKLLEKLKADKHVTYSNNENKVRLVEAEVAAATGDRDLALTKYQESVEAAQRESFFHEQALACEKAGNSLLEWGDYSKAREYFQSASTLYGQWGADAKVRDLSKRLERL
jgi:tetratricopeptide (TPR) repeat protein